VTGVYDDFADDVAERASERGELLVGEVEELGWKNEQEHQGWEMDLPASFKADQISASIVPTSRADVLFHTLG